jgi:hypothetical protein
MAATHKQNSEEHMIEKVNSGGSLVDASEDRSVSVSSASVASPLVSDSRGLVEAHAAIERAIEAASIDGLNVVGFGEVTLAVAWPTDAPTMVIKRLPMFANQARFDAYAALIRENMAQLAARGVPHVRTEVQSVPAADGGVVGYLVQPFLAPGVLLPDILRDCSEGQARAKLADLVDYVCAAVDQDLGLDAQLPNWAEIDGRLATLDVSTPFMRDRAGHHRLDLPLLVSIYPALLRHPLARWVLPGVLDRYHDRRAVLLDVAGNMMRQGLNDRLPIWLEEANRRLDSPITEAEVEKYFKSDTGTWAAMQRMRRLDSWWQRKVRRRPYPFLLAPRYDNKIDYSTTLGKV